MSRLSRFKKTELVKFPTASKKKSEESDSDDDDDFIKVNVKTKKSKRNEISQSIPSQSSTSTFSEYFGKGNEPSGSNKIPKLPKEERSQRRGNGQFVSSSPSSSGSANTSQCSTTSTSDKIKVKQEKKRELIEEPLSLPTSLDAANACSEVDVGQPKTKCPFCFKELANKLVGTTHIKSCAKDLPTEHVIKVMELYERQIEEWKELGINHPAFATNKKTTNTKGKKNPPRGGRGAGVSRRKKKEDDGGADPDIELALALSISLHEEVESRKQKTTDRREVELLELKQDESSGKPCSIFKNETEISEKNKKLNVFERPPSFPTPRTSTSLAPIAVKRRGKKVQLQTLPLYTVSEEDKKVRVAQKISRILEDVQTAKDEKFYIREEGFVEQLGVPKRLVPYQNKECTLWNLAEGGSDSPHESFKVLDLSERPMTELEMSVDVTRLPEIHLTSEESIRDGTDVMNKVEPLKVTATVTTKKTISNTSKPKPQSSSYPPLQVVREMCPVIRDMSMLLYNRVDCDLTLYGREEKRIWCHKLIVTARCPRLLKDVITETKGGQSRDVIPLTDFSHESVHAFVWYLYTGRIFSQDDKLMLELKELGKAYGINVEEKETIVDSIGKFETSIQTEIETTDSTTMTDIPADQKNLQDFGSTSVHDHALNRSTQELFTSIVEENNSAVLSTVASQSQPHSPNKIDGYIERRSETPSELKNEDHSASRDLFEDFDNDWRPNSEEKDIHSNDNDIHCLTQSSFHLEENDNQEIRDESSLSLSNGIDLNDIASPDVSQHDSSCAERKRSRSVSSSDFDCNRPSNSQLFSATQAAFILKKERKPECSGILVDEIKEKSGGYSDEEIIFQANKKQKLEIDSVLNIDSGFDSELKRNQNEEDKMNVDFVDVIKCNNETNFNFSNGEDSLLLNVASEFEKNHSNSDRLKEVINFSTPKAQQNQNCRKMFRSGSTPNLPSALNRFSFSQKNFEVDDDPFDRDGNDTLFANLNIPEVSNNISPVLCVGKSNVISINATLTPPTRIGKRLSPRNLSLEHEPLEPQIDTNLIPKAKRGGRGRKNAGGEEENQRKPKSKAAPKPKVTLPSRCPPNATSQSQTKLTVAPGCTTSSSASQQPRLAEKPAVITKTRNTGSRCSNNSASPMLNYCLIDTPILKQELKRYGLKPLPRSKAKVLLRHIYHETHK